MNSGFIHEDATKSADQEIWLTPPHILKALGEFDLDPCAAPDPKPWPTAKRHYTLPADDGLMLPWEGRVWCNPPYGPQVVHWLERMAMHGNGVALVFARTDTAVWHETIFDSAQAVLFIKGRICFFTKEGIEADTAGSPSALVAWGDANAEALANSSIKGHLAYLKKQKADHF